MSENDIRKLEGFALLKRLKSLLLNNNRIWYVSMIHPRHFFCTDRHMCAYAVWLAFSSRNFIKNPLKFMLENNFGPFDRLILFNMSTIALFVIVFVFLLWQFIVKNLISWYLLNLSRLQHFYKKCYSWFFTVSFSTFKHILDDSILYLYQT